ncbi:hypothetical protein CVT26_011538 [Gymnopilus dilepis]|uniref:Uncharacterized protein n=1 Tax=Gymnopilus dilepis TaxID=231916 RepID=A0A409X4I9_9AGAR|nr:hypothetical protein CVT26_011538 [Gymnopilus dilepis]
MQVQHFAYDSSSQPYDTTSCLRPITQSYPAYWTSTLHPTFFSYTPNDCGFLLAIGGSDSAFSSLGTAGFPASATGPGLAYSQSSPEDMSGYLQQTTDLDVLPESEATWPTYCGQLSLRELESEGLPPTAHIPTPGEMAIFLKSESLFEADSSQFEYRPPPSSTAVVGRATTNTGSGGPESAPVREKRYACGVCQARHAKVHESKKENGHLADSPMTSVATFTRRSSKRKSASNVSTHAGSPSSRVKAATKKRRRRAPSPSQWVPPTLQHFNLQSDDSNRVSAMPLPPVRRNLPEEERDSWHENIGLTPYHPRQWNGFLPGPGFGLTGCGR